MLAHTAVPTVPLPHPGHEASESETDTAIGVIVVIGLVVLVVGSAWFWWMKRRLRRRREAPPSITHQSGSGRFDRSNDS